jgi:tetratricopeptide (TPR) repeat protein
VQNSTQAAANWRHRAILIAAVAAVFAVTALCYWPSLSGPFIFDDAPNLELIGVRGGIDSFDAFVEFVSSAQAGPLGRPLSLASFVADSRTWPADPLPFKITNLLLHFVNGLLILFLAKAILALHVDRRTAWRLAVVCMAIWMIHPLLVSTTAYIIQRMTQLASLFVLTGLLSYIHGRKMLDSQPGRGWAWIVLGMGVSGFLAVFSKESGVLLPLYALVVEVTVFNHATLARRRKAALLVLLLVPALAMPAYVALNWEGLHASFEFRPFSMRERLLTQAVILVEYLKQVFAPSLSALGIIHDDFPVSRSLLNPATTLVSLLIIITAIAGALWQRRRWPVVSFGILWFFAGHSLEAGPMPIELYFEHRNYLPLIGPVIAVCSLLPLVPRRFGRHAYIGVALFLCFEAIVTWQSAKLWGDAELMMRVTAVHRPDSLRMQQYAGNQYILAGQFEQALEAQASIAANFPEHTSTRLSILNLQCLLGIITPEHISAARRFLGTGAFDRQIVTFFPVLLARAGDAVCPIFDLQEFRSLIGAVLDNPRIAGDSKTRGAVHYFNGLSLEKEGRLDEAVNQLDMSFEAWPEIDVRLRQVVWLLSAGRTEDAQRYLDLTRQFREERFWRRNLRDEDIKSLQQMINDRSRNSAPTPK